jgi:hypothetical protein
MLRAHEVRDFRSCKHTPVPWRAAGHRARDRATWPDQPPVLQGCPWPPWDLRAALRRLAKKDKSITLFQARSRHGRTDADDAAHRGALVAALEELGRRRHAVADAAVRHIDRLSCSVDGELQAMTLRKKKMETVEVRHYLSMH